MFEQALQDICNLYEGRVSRTGGKGCIRKEDVWLWSKESGLSVADTFDQVGIGLARAYADRTLDWDFCDEAANNLFSVLGDFNVDQNCHGDAPGYFWKFYLAFDHSETAGAEEADEVARNEINMFLIKISDGA